jgi:hypothetical protein
MWTTYLKSKFSGGMAFYPWGWRKINKKNEQTKSMCKTVITQPKMTQSGQMIPFWTWNHPTDQPGKKYLGCLKYWLKERGKTGKNSGNDHYDCNKKSFRKTLD